MFDQPMTQSEINSALMRMIDDLTTAMRQLTSVVSQRVEHDKQHFKFYCHVCDGIDNTLAELVETKGQ